MKRSVFVALLLFLGANGVHASIDGIFEDVSSIGNGLVDRAREAAGQQAEGGGPNFRSSKKGDKAAFAGRYRAPELPDEKKGRFVYGLAIFSDDGCDVTIDGEVIHSAVGSAQHLPDLGDSFHILPYVLLPGKAVDIAVNYANTTYIDDPLAKGYPDVDGCTLFLFLVPYEIVPDFDRNGTIDDKDRGQVSVKKPWRWWMNDDDDEGDLAKEDVPLGVGSPRADAAFDNDNVDGLCDLLDFFPLWFDIARVLEVFPPETCHYRLMQEHAAVRFVYTDLKPHDAGKFLVGAEASEALKSERSQLTVADGTTQLEETFLKKIRDEGKGVVLVEGRATSTGPLILQVFKEGKKLIEIPFPVSVSGVQEMYRWVNIRGAAGQAEGRHTDTSQPKNYPDSEANGKMFIFIHGYSVNERQSHGWHAEAFKRMYQSGSRAMFTGVSWHGDASQLPEILPPPLGGQALDYWENVTNAFKSAEALGSAVEKLPGSLKVSAAHSLGNMMVCAAIRDYTMTVAQHFMFDAAIPIEAFQSVANSEMRNPKWLNYDKRLWASEWHSLFDKNDGRSALSWRERFGKLPQLHNFYSSGEDVLDNSTGELPVPGAERIWALQEMIKGTGHPGAQFTLDSQGGWGFNGAWYYMRTEFDAFGKPYSISAPLEPEETVNLTPAQLRVKPFFRDFQDRRLMDETQGSGAAYEYLTRAKTLAEGIPALSFAAGRNEVVAFGSGRNVDLLITTNVDKAWPSKRLREAGGVMPDGVTGRWLHGDAKAVAYRFNYLLYWQWTELASLK